MIDVFNAIFSFVLDQGYFFIFILMFIEGPIVTYVASFAAALGYFNVWIILILAILGNLVPEVIVYKLGHLLRGRTAEKFVSYFGLHKKRVKWLEKNIKKHFIKTLLIIKAIPPLPTPGILLCGFLKVPFKKFILVDFLIDVIYTAIFVSLGYYSGLATSTSLKYFKLSQWLIPAVVIFIIVLYFLIKWISKKVEKNI